MVQGHRIKQKIEISKFLEQIQEYKEEDIEITHHTFFRLSEKQRKIFNEVWIKDIILNQKPFLVGIQYNNLWSLFYKYQNDIFRIIIDIQTDKIYIVSFYIIDDTQIPRI